MLEVIGTGFGRTGTSSLRLAINELGLGPCYHMKEVFNDSGRIADWRAAATDPGRLVPALEGYRSTVDWPGVSFWRRLIQDNPEAKVLHSERDPQEWYRSAYDTIFQASSAVTEQAFAEMDSERRDQITMVREMVWDGDFQGRFEDKDFAIEVFNRHNAAVRAEVPADRLLIFEVSQGWGPLCEFLGVPVPETPFPHDNSSQQFQQMVAERQAEAHQQANPGQ